ncbi:MAG: hypothetical protein HY648_09105, partial [Acidobacteria bacterium]|nr:hypothetical protein [Acidobacteriota bacterium]
MSGSPNNHQEITQRLGKIREQIRKRLERSIPPVPDYSPASVQPLREAQANASRLAAAIGTVDSQPARVSGKLILAGKRFLARMLDWHVRPQREFNQAVAQSLAETAAVLEATQKSVEAYVETLEEFRRAAQGLFQEHESLWEYLAGQWESQLRAHREEVEEQIKRQRWSYEG